jgi:hypothetical protein
MHRRQIHLARKVKFLSAKAGGTIEHESLLHVELEAGWVSKADLDLKRTIDDLSGMHPGLLEELALSCKA